MVRQGTRGVRGRVAGTALVVAAGLTLTGCGDVSPGAAATVDGTAIARDTVDEIAQSVCTAEVEYAALTEQQFQPRPTSAYRDDVLSLLVNEQLALEAVDELGLDVPPSSYEAGDNPELSDLFEQLPSSQLEPFQDYLTAYSRLQALYVAIGSETGESGGDDPQAALTDGQAYVAEYAEERDIELDPRFGDFRGGQVVGGSGSVSVPVEGAGSEPSPEEQADVSGLPDSQICQ
jgi:hypothetical protein